MGNLILKTASKGDASLIRCANQDHYWHLHYLHLNVRSDPRRRPA